MNDKEMQVVVEPLANQESEKEVWRRPDLDTDGRATPKLKMFSDVSSKYSTSLLANLLLTMAPRPILTPQKTFLGFAQFSIYLYVLMKMVHKGLQIL